MENSFLQWLAQPELTHYLMLGAMLFCIGITLVLTRRNVIMVLMGIELILNSANINFIAFSRYSVITLDGHLTALFLIILAAAEAAVALAIVLNIYNRFKTIDIDEISLLKG